MRELKETFRLNEITSLTASRVLSVGMLFCASLSFQQLFRFFIPDWQGNHLPWICLLVTLEAIPTYERLRRTSDLDHSRMYYRVQEVVVLLVVIKVIMYLWNGVAAFFQEAPLWAENFLDSFFSAEYILTVLGAFFCWGMMTWNLLDLAEIEGDTALVDASTLDGYFSNRSQIRRRMTGRFLTIGFGMMLINGVAAIDFRALFRGELLIKAQGTLNLVVYFLLCMLLLSQTHFSVLRAGWAWERIPIDPGMAKRWVTYTLVALGAVALVAFLLPTNYSLGLLSTLSFVISLIVMLLYSLFFLIALPFFTLFRWLAQLLDFGQGPVGNLPPPSLPEPPPEMAASPLPPWIKILQSILFWAVFLLIIGFALVQYVRQNKELMRRLRKVRLFRLLVQTWSWLRGRLGGLNRAVTAAVGAGVERIRALFSRPALLEAWRIINPRRLPPRLQVLFFYLTLVRRGGEAGLPRQPDQTPYEYARSISRSLPEVDQDVQDMTESFVEARYSQHAITPERAGLVQRFWAHIRQALRPMKSRR